MDEYGDMSRYDASPDGIVAHTNDVLICKDCEYRFDIVGSCERYTFRKPEGILDDTHMCPHYVKETAQRSCAVLIDE